MPKFTWNDLVRVVDDAPKEWRPGEYASVVAITEESERKGSYLEQFPHGTTYRIEFDDGSDVEVTEDRLELIEAEDPQDKTER